MTHPAEITSIPLPATPPITAEPSAVVEWARESIVGTREWVAANNALGRGIEIAEAHTEAVDAVVRKLFASVVGSGDDVPRGIALVAQGGYGRRQMSLRSDVDLLILEDGNPSAKTQSWIRALIQMLWDVGGEIGHTVKSVKEALSAVGTDLAQTTALFETRHLAGDEALTQELQTGLRRLLDRGALSTFLRDRIEEMRGRHERWGNTVYLLEPNVKDGKGGLRDVHLCQWIAFACLRKSTLDSLAEAEVISSEELERLHAALDFLLAVRNSMHAAAGRKDDALDFSKQRAVAQALGIAPTDAHALPEEHLLHLCHRHARVIDRLADRVVNILPTRTTMTSRLTRRFQTRTLRGGWVSCQGEVTFGPKRPDDSFDENPGLMLEVCAVARERGLRLSDEVQEAITRRCQAEIDEALLSDCDNTERFLRILRGPAHTASTLRTMSETGLLGAFMPEYRRIHSMVRIDSYHRYTVDEHTLKCIEAAEALITGQLNERESGLTDAAHRIERWDLLMLGLLLHDIGKGEGRGHVVKGGQIAQRIAQRMGLDEEEAMLVRELVLGHLWIPHLAFRRDIEDPEVVNRLAKQVGSVELLRMLFVLTFADISGVNPNNWTAWKGQLIWSLYRQTVRALEGRPSNEWRDAGPNPDEMGEQLLAKLENDGETVLQAARALIASSTARYRRAVTPTQMAEHARLIARITDTDRAAWRIVHPKKCNYSEITIATVDEPGVFGLLCGAIASKGINILSAQAFSTEDGHVIDTFQVTSARGEPLPHDMNFQRVKRLVDEVLRRERTLDETFPVELGDPLTSPEAIAMIPTRVELDNAGSSHCTILEVRTHDRVGLLHALTNELTRANLMIYLAMITTEAYRVVDVFYLTDLENMKIDDPKRLEQIESSIRALLGAPGGAEGQ